MALLGQDAELLLVAGARDRSRIAPLRHVDPSSALIFTSHDGTHFCCQSPAREQVTCPPGRPELSAHLLRSYAILASVSRRHLSLAETAAALARNRQVEQLLGVETVDGRAAVRWLTVRRDGSSFQVTRHEVEDVGTEDYLDVSTFPPLDDDEYPGEGTVVGEAVTPDAALDLATSAGADPERWVNEGVVQHEYAETRHPR